jgi:beta-1,4-mannosyltransferase
MTIRQAIWPKYDKVNAYLDLYYQALSEQGIKLVSEFKIQDEHLRRDRDKLDALHFQWSIEEVWRAYGNSDFRQMRGVIAFWKYLRLAKKLGYKIIWTMHDVERFEGARLADRYGYRLLAKFSDLLLCHSNSASVSFSAICNVPQSKIMVIPIGNYDGVFPAPRSRDQTLHDLHIDPNAKVILCAGLIRSYKGFETAIEAMKYLGSNHVLVIAGKPSYAEYGATIENLVSQATNVRLLPYFIENQLMADLHAAADVVLIPYRKITGSATLLTALTLSRGVVVSDLPYMREVLGVSDAAVFFEAGNPSDLARAVHEFFASSTAHRHASARLLANNLPWSEVVRPVVQWFQSEFRNASSMV